MGRRYCRLIKAEWPSTKLAALRSSTANPCQKLEELDSLFINIEEAMSWSPATVIIASPASMHQELALHFAQTNIPILIEKPVGLGTESKDDWNLLLKYSESTPIYVGYVLRHDPCAAFVRQQLAQGALGLLISADFHCGSWLPDWRPDQDYRKTVSAQKSLGGGVLLELSHELDMAQWLLGPLDLSGSFIQNSGLLELDVEDQAIILAKSKTSCMTSIRLDFCTNPPKRSIVIRGSNAELRWNLIKGTVTIEHLDLPEQFFCLSVSPDERLARQLRAFSHSSPKKSDATLCSLQEALDVLDLVKLSRILNSQPS